MIMNAAQWKAELKQFTGTENWYQHALFRAFTYTDGVRFVAREAGAYWLLDRIFGLQYESEKIQGEPFQVWDLKVHDDKTATLTCTDGNDGPVHQETISFTDFPISTIRFYLINQVLLLPSEY